MTYDIIPAVLNGLEQRFQLMQRGANNLSDPDPMLQVVWRVEEGCVCRWHCLAVGSDSRLFDLVATLLCGCCCCCYFLLRFPVQSHCCVPVAAEV